MFGCARREASIRHERYRHFCADVSAEDDVRAVVRKIRSEAGALDVLINNAGAARMLPALLTPTETARRLIETNFLGTFIMTREATRLLRKSPCGRIINFTSVAVPLRLEGESVYVASKSAIEGFTRTIAKELGPLGITCNAVGPTPIRTDLIRGVPEDKLEALIQAQAIAEWAEPDDVFNIVDFLLRPQSRLVTGQVIYLGGLG